MNPNFITWNKHDQLLCSFLLASMSESAQSQMIGCHTSSQLWTRVSQLFATRSTTLCYSLQSHLHAQFSLKDLGDVS
ncbi:putative inactive receptor-like protein kinase [Dorcoceras hygrometricum]|uniref:Putative inactive receptor-like protein kinase n=1 Tax=Dorcoceras hygrometricum TaxID=472368 RepID=A0A2Z7BLJ5_9LAMI|nr:putative inactive receptor-like protein kinase [Dorcoceras hygrometricum]